MAILALLAPAGLLAQRRSGEARGVAAVISLLVVTVLAFAGSGMVVLVTHLAARALSRWVDGRRQPPAVLAPDEPYPGEAYDEPAPHDTDPDRWPATGFARLLAVGSRTNRNIRRRTGHRLPASVRHGAEAGAHR